MIVLASFTILGEPASKANQRRIVNFGDRTALVKSKKALDYERSALMQIPPIFRIRHEGPVSVTLRIFYASERPDLDESIVLDVLQDRWRRPPRGVNAEPTQKPEARIFVQAGVYRNDRQVREKHVFHGIDKRNPRAEIRVEALQVQQAMPLPVELDPLGAMTA